MTEEQESAHAEASAIMQQVCDGCPNQGRCPQPCKFYNEQLLALMYLPHGE